MWKISFGNVEQWGSANFCSSSQFIVDALSSHRNAIFRLYVRFHNWDWQDFSKGFSLRIKKEKQRGNSASPFVLLGLHCSYSRAKLQRDPAPQERLFQRASGDSQHEGDVQVFLHLMRHVEPENVPQRRSAAKQSTDAERGFRKCSFLIKSFSCCQRCQAAPRGQRQLRSHRAGGSRCCPQPSSGTRAPRTFTTSSSRCSVVSTEL